MMNIIDLILRLDLNSHVNEKYIMSVIDTKYFSIDQRREFNEHLYRYFVISVVDADDEVELSKSDFESVTFKDDYLDGYISNHDILVELEQYLSSDEKDDLEDWLIDEFGIYDVIDSIYDNIDD